MKILVLGAGAVGGYFGGRLAEAGADVSFLVRPARAALMAKQGLRVRSPVGDLNLKVRCVVAGEVRPEYDVVMLTAKAYDLDSAVAAVAPAFEGGKGFLLPLLNGMNHLEALDARFGADRVLGGVAYIASTLAPDGEIRHMSDFNSIAFGPRRASQEAVCEALAGAAAKSKSEFKRLDNILQAMWDKWVFLASLGGITCLMRSPVCDYVATGAGSRIALGLLEECMAVAAAEGFATPAPVVASYRARITDAGSTLAASMMRDIEGGLPAEGDHILGAMLARARAKGLPAPILEIAATHVEAYTARRTREAAAKKPG